MDTLRVSGTIHLEYDNGTIEELTFDFQPTHGIAPTVTINKERDDELTRSEAAAGAVWRRGPDHITIAVDAEAAPDHEWGTVRSIQPDH